MRSRKRNHGTDHDGEEIENKRRDTVNTDDAPEPFRYEVKILIPGYGAGAILGKGGQRIVEMQAKTGTKIKMSKSNDVYPGTAERVCLITGSKQAVLEVLGIIRDKLRGTQDFNVASNSVNPSTDRWTQIKVLIPNSCAGMIIGKNGAVIRQLQENSGASVRLSHKTQTLQDRILTIAGEKSNCLKAMESVLRTINEGIPMSDSANLGYKHLRGPDKSNDFRLRFDLSRNTPLDPESSGRMMEKVRESVNSGGYNDQASVEITDAVRVLLSHGILRPDEDATRVTNDAATSERTNDDLDNIGSEDVEIEDGMIERVLGPSGECMVEIQRQSGARVEVSEKGLHGNRVISILGLSDQISMAKKFIANKISEITTSRQLIK